jgi:hypothetical protein
VSTPIRSVVIGELLAITSVMRAQRSLLDALGETHDGCLAFTCRARLGEHRAQSVRRHREHDHVGRAARFGEISGRPQLSGSGMSRRVVGVLVVVSIALASSGRRAHNTVGSLPATIAATAVPHEPAPMTATRVMPTAGACGRFRISATTRVFARLAARRIDLARACDALDDGSHHALGRLLHVLVGPARSARRPRPSAGPPLPVRLAALRQDPVRPHRPTGVIATSDRRAGAVPDLASIGSRSWEIVPSGNTPMHSPRASASTAAVSASPASERPRRTGIWCAARSSEPEHALLEELDLAR